MFHCRLAVKYDLAFCYGKRQFLAVWHFDLENNVLFFHFCCFVVIVSGARLPTMCNIYPPGNEHIPKVCLKISNGRV